MKEKIVFFLLVFLPCFSLLAQNWNEIYYLETEAEYLLEEKKYDKAIEMYQKILKETPDNSFIKFKIGLAYLKTDNQKEKAITTFEEILDDVSADFDPRDIRETRAPLEGYLYLGVAYQKNNRIDDAKKMYIKYKESIPSDHYNFSLVNQYIESCNYAEKMMSTPERIQTRNLGDKVNDDNSNFNAVFSGDGNTMIFTSYTKNYIDIYQSKKNGDSWSSPKNITNQVSKKYYLKTSSLSYEGDELYLATDDPEGNDIFVSYLEGKQWTNADKLHKTISHRKSNETHAGISPDGNTIYFTSNREGGYGGLDLYKSTRDAKGKWNDAENLGAKINTPFNEETPLVSGDGKYLFFSSEGHNSMGGYDVFYIDLSNPDKVINMGFPVNSTSDDLFFVPGETKNTGYMARVQDDTQGKKDIYYLKILPDIQVKGKIYHLAQGEMIDDKALNVQVINLKKDTIIQSLEINNGEFNFKTGPGTYQISILNEQFEPFEREIIIPENFDEEFYAFNAELKPKIDEQEDVAERTELVAEEPGDSVSKEDDSEYVAEKEDVMSKEAVTEQPDAIQKVGKKELLADKIPNETNVTAESYEEISEVTLPEMNVTEGGSSFSVQLMALRTPVALNYFRDIDNITATKHPDGFYRYTVGLTNSYEEAQRLQSIVNTQGYEDAFIRKNPFTANYTIQLMALIVPVELNYFKNLPTVTVTRGNDDYYRYVFGYYNAYDEAQAALENLKKSGYGNAFIKKIKK